jgi:hypothetical protein
MNAGSAQLDDPWRLTREARHEELPLAVVAPNPSGIFWCQDTVRTNDFAGVRRPHNQVLTMTIKLINVQTKSVRYKPCTVLGLKHLKTKTLRLLNLIC